MRTLKLISGPAAGQEIEIDRELVIGREDADVTIDDEQISRRHLVLRPVEDGVELEDLGSLNGTFVDGERIDRPVTIAIRGVVTIGTSELHVDVPLPLGSPGDQATQLSASPLGQTIQARVPFSTEPALEKPPLPPAGVPERTRPRPRVPELAASVVVVAAFALAALLIVLR
jgi:pSer/pThr/pTyr-binding forkhead associated (FHA) protein